MTTQLPFERAASVNATEHMETSTYRRVTVRLLPLLFICYMVSYLDRVNVSFAKLQMLNDLHFSEAVYGLGAGSFFIGYFMFEVPSNIIMLKVGARRWIARIMITWGVLSAMMALVETSTSFYVLRFFLGVAEAGFYPGVILYLAQWFPSDRRGRITALFVAGNPVSGIVGGPLSGYILHALNGALGLAGWQWLFIVEAIPAFVLGLVVFFFLDDSIQSARWLDNSQKQLLQAAVDNEAKTKIHLSFRALFSNRSVLLFCLIYFGISVGSNTFGFWQPAIIRASGIENSLYIGLFSSLPYMIALGCMLVVGHSADHFRERRWHLAVPIICAACGFIVCAAFKDQVGFAMIGLVMVACGIISSITAFWALPTAYLGGPAAAAGIALINSTGNLGGFVSPVIMGWMTTATHSLTSGLYLVSVWMVLTALIVLMFVSAKTVNR